MSHNDVLKNLSALERLRNENKLFRVEPYDWQKEFFSQGKNYRNRMIIAGNRCGKTYTAAIEVSFHLTGRYPDWWEGVRFNRPITVWCGGVTNDSLRDISQYNLIGGYNSEKLGTGLIPKKYIKNLTAMLGAGSGTAERAFIEHSSGGQSEVYWKSYLQGREKWQGSSVDLIWMDEEPRDYMLFSEAITRLVTTNGHMLVTFTPLLGQTELLLSFNQLHKKSLAFIKNIAWDDCPHLSEAIKNEMAASYNDYERDCRMKGIPLMGEGVVFPFSEETIKVQPFQIPNYFGEVIGIDFGYDHPAATVKVAHDRDNDIVYITDARKKSKMSALEHCGMIRAMGGKEIPISYPHDGLNHEKGTGLQLIQQYKEHDLNFLSMTARYKTDVGGAQSKEKIVMDVYERIQTGRLKVFSNNSEWFEEYRNFHRKDGKLVALRDDLLSATFYAVMMLRCAISDKEQHSNNVYAFNGPRSKVL